MLPDWLDSERLEALLALAGVLAVIAGLLTLTLVRRPAVKVIAVVLLGAVAVGVAWQVHAIDDARRTDCADVEVLGARVVVPSCPDPTT